MRSKALALNNLQLMLRDALAAQTRGDGVRLARAQGLVDGYMRALLDLGVVSTKEMLTVVSTERTSAHGPAVRSVEPADLDDVAVA